FPPPPPPLPFVALWPLPATRRVAAVRRLRRWKGQTGSAAFAPPLDRHDRSPPRPASAALVAPLSKGDRVFLYPAHIDIPPDLGNPIVEHDFEVKSTTRCIVYTCPYGTSRRQEISTQKIDVPKLGADVRDVDFYNSHPRVIGELDPLIERRGGKPGG